MRYFTALAAFVLIFSSCKKDNYTTVPQIEYVSVNPNFVDATVPGSSLDQLSANVNFKLTDAEGDIGYKDGKDTSFIYLKNLLTGKQDSVAFPDLTSISKKDFNAVVGASLGKVIQKRNITLPVGTSITDTLYFEIYVKDFEKHKSNVIKTADPVFFKYF